MARLHLRCLATISNQLCSVWCVGDNKRSGQDSKAGKAATSSKQNKKKPVVQPLAKAPTNSRENAESVLWFVAVAGLFLTGGWKRLVLVKLIEHLLLVWGNPH